MLRAAAASGDDVAQQQLSCVTACDLSNLTEAPAKERLHDTSAVFVCRGYAPAAICDYLIERAQAHQSPSLVTNERTGEVGVGDMRTALSSGVELDFIAAIMQTRAAHLTRVPIANHEPPNVISYEVGQKFDYHYDYIDPNNRAVAGQLFTFGQRTITVITYLNTEYEGAETDFPLLGLSFKGNKGDALVFANVLPNGTPDANTRHSGLPPTSGRKWVLSQWIRNQAQPRPQF